MYRLTIFVVSVLLLSLQLSPLFAEEKPGKNKEVMPLWANAVPLQVTGKQEEERWAKWGLVNVHTPTLTIYPANKSKATGMAILVIPGGGYSQVCMNHEGHRVAEWFSAQGVAAFVLKYRVKPYSHPVPLLDAQRAMRTIRFNAKRFSLDPARIGVIGFSAGGHLAASLSNHFDMKVGDSDGTIDAVSARPDFAVLGYPVISMEKGITHGGSRRNLIGAKPEAAIEVLMSMDKQVSKETPPTFLVHGRADKGVVPANSERYYAALEEHQVPAKLFYVDKAGHGFGLHHNWAEPCLAWLQVLLQNK